jgi:hypothetical protein
MDTHILEGREDAEDAVRRMFKEGVLKVPPMVLDAGVWHIGFHYCREKPECDICPKHIEGEGRG